jgi:hypothetical protein
MLQNGLTSSITDEHALTICSPVGQARIHNPSFEIACFVINEGKADFFTTVGAATDSNFEVCDGFHFFNSSVVDVIYLSCSQGLRNK